LIRFVNMFLKRGIKISMFSAGYDANGENVLNNADFEVFKIKSFEISFTNMLNKIFLKVRKNKSSRENYFEKIKSEDIIAPYGSYNIANSVNKWFKWVLIILDNIFLIVYLGIKYPKTIKESTAIIGYEASYTICARVLAKLFYKQYVNKFQGTILKATNRNKVRAIKSFPHNFFSINNSDLCLMVNDGTDGKYYAQEKGCKEIFFEPHGVYEYDKDMIDMEIINKLKRQNKFILFNNASGSTWKRTDRIVRSFMKLDEELREHIVLITTYYAADREDLKKFVKSYDLDKNIIFMEKLDNFECNSLLRNSDIAIMTNDFSNLGNPLLEAIYYGIPIISIDDGSLDGFLENGKDSILVKLDCDFDKNLSLAIEKLYFDKGFYLDLKKNLNKHQQVKELNEQQEREFNAINEILKLC